MELNTEKPTQILQNPSIQQIIEYKHKLELEIAKRKIEETKQILSRWEETLSSYNVESKEDIDRLDLTDLFKIINDCWQDFINPEANIVLKNNISIFDMIFEIIELLLLKPGLNYIETGYCAEQHIITPEANAEARQYFLASDEVFKHKLTHFEQNQQTCSNLMITAASRSAQNLASCLDKLTYNPNYLVDEVKDIKEFALNNRNAQTNTYDDYIQKLSVIKTRAENWLASSVKLSNALFEIFRNKLEIINDTILEFEQLKSNEQFDKSHDNNINLESDVDSITHEYDLSSTSVYTENTSQTKQKNIIFSHRQMLCLFDKHESVNTIKQHSPETTNETTNETTLINTEQNINNPHNDINSEADTMSTLTKDSYDTSTSSTSPKIYQATQENKIINNSTNELLKKPIKKPIKKLRKESCHERLHNQSIGNIKTTGPTAFERELRIIDLCIEKIRLGENRHTVFSKKTRSNTTKTTSNSTKVKKHSNIKNY